VRKPGWEIRVRSRTYLVGAAKIKGIQEYLDTVRRLQVDIDGSGYTIAAVRQTGDILPMGQEPDSDRRENFTLNGTITHKELLT